MQTEPCSARSQRTPPADRVEARRSIDRKCDKFRASADGLERYRSAEPPFREAGAAIGAVIAIVSHKEKMPLGYPNRAIPVQLARPGVDDCVVTARWEIFLPNGQDTDAVTCRSDLERTGKLAGGAGGVFVHRQDKRRQRPLRQRYPVQYDLACTHLQNIARQTDYPLDIILVAMAGRNDNNIAAPREVTK